MVEHNHMCARECGNVAENVLVNLNDSSADIICTPCLVKLANDIVKLWAENMDAEAVEIPGVMPATGIMLDFGPGRPEEEPDMDPEFSPDEVTKTGPQRGKGRDVTVDANSGTIQLDTTPPPPDPNLPAAFR